MKAVMLRHKQYNVMLNSCRRNGKYEYDPHYPNLRNGTKFGPATMWLDKDGLADAYDNSAMEYVLIFVLANIT
jgi:hypothetical protein